MSQAERSEASRMTATSRAERGEAADTKAISALSLSLSRGALEIKQFLRSRESVVFSLAFPLMMMGIFGSIFTFTVEGTDVKMTQYFVTGMIAAGIISVSFQSLAIQIPIERDRGVLKRLQGTPMPKAAYFAGKVVMVAAIAVVEIILLLLVATVAFGVKLPSTPEKWFTFGWVVFLGLTACTLLGIAFSSVARTGRSAPAVVTPVALVLQFISGVYFVYTQLPDWMQQVAAIFPLKWMAQGLRSVFLPESFARTEAAGSFEHGKTAAVLAIWCVIGLALCLTTFRWTTKRDG